MLLSLLFYYIIILLFDTPVIASEQKLLGNTWRMEDVPYWNTCMSSSPPLYPTFSYVLSFPFPFRFSNVLFFFIQPLVFDSRNPFRNPTPLEIRLSKFVIEFICIWGQEQSSVWPSTSACLPSSGLPSKMYLPSSQRYSTLSLSPVNSLAPLAPLTPLTPLSPLSPLPPWHSLM